jgi:hypothetical protein
MMILSLNLTFHLSTSVRLILRLNLPSQLVRLTLTSTSQLSVRLILTSYPSDADFETYIDFSTELKADFETDFSSISECELILRLTLTWHLIVRLILRLISTSHLSVRLTKPS